MLMVLLWGPCLGGQAPEGWNTCHLAGGGGGTWERALEGRVGPHSRQVPGLSNLAEDLIHLQEKLPRDILQSQEVLCKQRLY